MDTPDLTALQAALAASQATRTAVRGMSPDDPERVSALRTALGSLKETWTADHRAYVRSGRRYGRVNSDDPVRALAREREAETRRLHKLLAPSSGTPYKAATERRTADQMSGTLARAVGVLNALQQEHEAFKRVFGGGSWTATKGGGRFRNMRELNAEAAKLREQLHTYRIDLNAAWAAYERHLESGRASAADARRFDHLADRLELWRKEADKLAAELRSSMRRRTPLERTQERWTADSARKALRGFEMSHGRPPRKADCHPRFNLPHYTQLRRLLGPNPLSSR